MRNIVTCRRPSRPGDAGMKGLLAPLSFKKLIGNSFIQDSSGIYIIEGMLAKHLNSHEALLVARIIGPW